MKILVLGPRGYVGQGVQQMLGGTATLCRLGEFMPDMAKGYDAVVNCAGMSDVQACENNEALTRRVNVLETLHALECCARAGVRAIHLSTSCVWNGPYNNGNPFKPDDPVNPQCSYARSKAECDDEIKKEMKGRVWILRPRQIFSEHLSIRNALFRYRMPAYARMVDESNSMTSLSTLMRTIAILVHRMPQGSGIVSVYDRGITSPYRVAISLSELGLRARPALISQQDLDGILRPKRVNTTLEDGFFEQIVAPPRIEDQIKKFVGRLKHELARANPKSTHGGDRR